jgi:hypothetical protein
MPQPPRNLPDDDESQGVTQEANFPLAWIKDYDPKLHGIRPKSIPQPPGPPQNQPPGPTIRPSQVSQPAKMQPPPRSYPPEAQIYSPPTPQNRPLPPGQWNPGGVYGGVPKPKEKSFPWWGWVLLEIVVLIILALIGYALKIYLAF